MAEKQQENPFQTLWRWYTAGNTVWSVAVSSGVTLLVVRTFPANWKTPGPWLLVIFAFSVTWGVLQLMRAAGERLRRWWNPPTASISLFGGQKATLRLQHKGFPTTYSADGRIETLLSNGTMNPAEQWFRCQMQFKGTEGGWEVTLQDDEWVHIVVGAIVASSSIAIRRGPQSAQTMIPDDGAIMEYVIRAKPRLKSGDTIRTRIGITRVNNSLVLALKE